ncbi:hypothetical protein [Pseudochrobactrum sp. B5]|uniref:hypothetical protein n=1 Tax=Pseudochrobactrum sp. B5 TaxID=1289478 RepID=UPI0009527339|nr:hypothetical protein [Pseudochrobactrum sp. B5]
MLNLSEAILATLPPVSRIKLERQLSDRDAAHAAYRAASDREQEARAELGFVSGLAQQQKEAHQGSTISFQGHRQQEDKQAVAERIDAPVAAAKRALQVAVDARERAAERQNAFGFLDNIETWIRRAGSDGRFREARPVDLKLTARTDLSAEVAKVRARIAEAEEAFAKAENAPAPASDLKDRAFAEIDRIAALGALKIHPANRSAEPLALARKLAIHSGNNNSIVGTGGSDVMVWLMHEELRKKVSAMIDALPQTGALTDDEREAAFGDLAAARLELERIEEQLISTAEVDGHIIARRVDLDPRAFLGIEA